MSSDQPAPIHPERRTWLARTAATVGALSAVSTLSSLGARAAVAASPALHQRPLPRQGGNLPVIGLGSWISFNVGNDPAGLANCTAIIRAFLAAGGRLIDSSPMYGSSQPAIGQALATLAAQAPGGKLPDVFAADKVWIGDARRGSAQMAESLRHWGLPRFDLMQVHNLLSWQDHLPQLLAMRAQGSLRFVGVSTSHGRRHDDLAQIMRSQPIDFVQLTYNLVDRDVEQRLLPLAQERGIAVIVNRPLRGGELPRRLARQPLPGWAADIGCRHWAQVALKFCAAHPAVRCVIPATSQLAHLQQNMAAGTGALPDAALRQRMADDVARL